MAQEGATCIPLCIKLYPLKIYIGEHGQSVPIGQSQFLLRALRIPTVQLYHDLFDLLNGQLAYFLSFSRQCYKEYPWTFPFACLSLSASEFLEISQKDYALTDIAQLPSIKRAVTT